jgi:transposase
MRIEAIDVSVEELEQLVEQTGEGPLPPEGQQKLRATVATLRTLAELLTEQKITIEQLRAMLLGPRTCEKTRKVLGDANEAAGPAEARCGSQTNPSNSRRKGHGRNSAAVYSSAPKVSVRHPILKVKDRCPECLKGKVYPLSEEPKSMVRITGQPPLKATVYELEALRCNLCGEVFIPPTPAGVSEEKYDETAVSMIALLKYGTGLPFKRMERLESHFGIPLPAATAWEIVAAGAASLAPVWDELIRQAAQGEIIHNDDTSMKILRFVREVSDSRTGLFTTGIVSRFSGHSIALFFTGRQHAGENLADLLRQRDEELGPPIQMCDALSRNAPGTLKVILGNCLAHARRHFVDVVMNFPAECRYVLEILGEVFHQDILACEQQMEPDDRLRFHQQHSSPLMDQLHAWCCRQFDERKVEPNSGLGKAIQYLFNHWSELTLFLRQPGAPIDNNICERALKKVVLHRKNALFYRTQNGARVGDLFMSLIYTAELCGANPFDYLTELQRHEATVARAPAQWLPWNYRSTLLELALAA